MLTQAEALAHADAAKGLAVELRRDTSPEWVAAELDDLARKWLALAADLGPDPTPSTLRVGPRRTAVVAVLS